MTFMGLATFIFALAAALIAVAVRHRACDAPTAARRSVGATALWAFLVSVALIPAGCGGNRERAEHKPPPSGTAEGRIVREYGNPNVNVYMTASRNMDGFIDGSDNEFKRTVGAFINEVNRVADTVNLFYINDAVAPAGSVVRNYASHSNINASGKGVKGWNKSNPDIAAQLDTVFSHQSDTGVQIFISDFLGKDDIIGRSRDVIQPAIVNYLKRNGLKPDQLGVRVYQLFSGFKGRIHYKSNNATIAMCIPCVEKLTWHKDDPEDNVLNAQGAVVEAKGSRRKAGFYNADGSWHSCGLRSARKERPYYICVIGNPANLSAFHERLTHQKVAAFGGIEGTTVNTLDIPSASTVSVKYEFVDTRRERKGTYDLSDDKRTMKKMEKSKGGSTAGSFSFVVGLDLSPIQGENVYPDEFKVLIDGRDVGQSRYNMEWSKDAADGNYTHKVRFSLKEKRDDPRIKDLTIVLPYRGGWIKETSIDNFDDFDAAARENRKTRHETYERSLKKTFGLKHILNSIEDGLDSSGGELKMSLNFI